MLSLLPRLRGSIDVMPPEPAETRFYLHKEFKKSKSAWWEFTRSKCDHSLYLWPTCRFFPEPEPWAYKQLTHFSLFKLFEILQLPALLLSLPPRVALFSERAPWAHKQSSRFTVFVISENSSSSVVLLPLAPVSLIVQLFDAFLAFSLLFGSFLLYVQEGSAASIQVDMQIEAAARLKSTVSDLPALEISRNISFGAPPRIFFHDI